MLLLIGSQEPFAVLVFTLTTVRATADSAPGNYDLQGNINFYFILKGLLVVWKSLSRGRKVVVPVDSCHFGELKMS